MITRKDLVVAVLLTFCLSAALFSVISTKSQYDPWTDLNDDGVIDSTDLGTLGTGWGTYGDPAKNVTILGPVDGQGNLVVNSTGRRSKLIRQASPVSILPGQTYSASYIPVDGYAKVTVCIWFNTNNNRYTLLCIDDNGIAFQVDSITNFANTGLVKTYDVMNTYLAIQVYNGEAWSINLYLDIYLVA